MMTTVFVTGMGLVTPLRPFASVDMFWNALCSGEDAIRRMAPPMLDMEREWLMGGISTGDGVRAENKFCLIAEGALEMAIKDSGLEERASAGISVGTVLGNVLLKEKRLQVNGRNGIRQGSERESLSYITSHLAGKYGLKGPQFTVSTACASGTDAIGIAARTITDGRADVMVAGGVDVLSDFALIGFHALQALTGEKVRPFDKNRSGLALGEGAAFLVLESERHAVSRKARLYGRIRGYASRADANHLTGPHKEGRGLSDAIRAALSQARLSPHEVGYINAHGTGTIYNDLMETIAIKNVFRRTAYDIPISSTKSMLGHSFGAAGAIETICCLLSIRDNIVPPTINLVERDPECDLDYVPKIARHAIVKQAVSLSAGFGGQNAAIVVGEA